MKSFKKGVLLLAAIFTGEFMSCHKATERFDVNKLTCLVDLHLHLDGAISTESAKQLASLQGIEIPSSDEEIEKIMRVSDDCSDLNEFLEKFDFPCSLLRSEIGVKTAVENLLSELEEEGVMYAEIRFAPQFSVGRGISQEQAVRAAIEGTKRAHIPSNIILCCMRGADNHEANVETVRLTKKYYGRGVCALDIAGAEGLFPTKDFRDIFELAKSEGLRFTIHAGEAAGPESVWDAIDFGASRIGHGIRSLEDERLVAYLSEHKIPLDICPTSNVCTAVFSDISEYPIRTMIEKGLCVTINTDDPAIENTSIKKEFKKLIDKFDLSKDEVKQLLTNSVNASFAEESVKKELLKKIESQIK